MRNFSLLILFSFLVLACQSQENLVFQGKTMGTTYQVKIADAKRIEAEASRLQSMVDQALQEVNRQMSTYRPDSEISQFNRRYSTQPMKVSPSFVQVLRSAVQIYQESRGRFDVTVAPLVDLWGFGKKGSRFSVPDPAQIDSVRANIGTKYIRLINDSTIAKSNPNVELDLSAIAKGYGADVVAELLNQQGYHNYLVEIGGEVVVKGLNHGEKWKIGIDRPHFGALPGQELEGVLLVNDLAIATSGDYRNFFMIDDTVYSHTINPSTGRPIANGMASVTIIAPSCMLADAIATAVMVMGAEDGLRWVESKPDVEALIITRDRDGKFVEKMSNGFDRYLK